MEKRAHQRTALVVIVTKKRHWQRSMPTTSLLILICRIYSVCLTYISPPYTALQLEQTTVKSLKSTDKWVLYLLKLSFFSPLVRQVSRCLLINCLDTLTEHTGHATAKRHRRHYDLSAESHFISLPVQTPSPHLQTATITWNTKKLIWKI